MRLCNFVVVDVSEVPLLTVSTRPGRPSRGSRPSQRPGPTESSGKLRNLVIRTGSELQVGDWASMTGCSNVSSRWNTVADASWSRASTEWRTAFVSLVNYLFLELNQLAQLRLGCRQFYTVFQKNRVHVFDDKFNYTVSQKKTRQLWRVLASSCID